MPPLNNPPTPVGRRGLATRSFLLLLPYQHQQQQTTTTAGTKSPIMTKNPPVGWIHGHKEDGTVLLRHHHQQLCQPLKLLLLQHLHSRKWNYHLLQGHLQKMFGFELWWNVGWNNGIKCDKRNTIDILQGLFKSTRPAGWGDIERVEN
jgi:hypothetical protein